jgi:hypothetical protein
MAKVLEENGPTRADLFNFVATVMWLEPYQDADGDVDIELVTQHVKEAFRERFSWYDPAITEYQVQYEYSRSATRYFPRGCNHPSNQGGYCIGKDNCDYSIYGSLNLSGELYDRLPGDGGANQGRN